MQASLLFFLIYSSATKQKTLSLVTTYTYSQLAHIKCNSSGVSAFIVPEDGSNTNVCIHALVYSNPTSIVLETHILFNIFSYAAHQRKEKVIHLHFRCNLKQRDLNEKLRNIPGDFRPRTQQ